MRLAQPPAPSQAPPDTPAPRTPPTPPALALAAAPRPRAGAGALLPAKGDPAPPAAAGADTAALRLDWVDPQMPALPWLCYDPVPTAAQDAAPGLVEPDEVLRLARAEPGRYSGERQAAAGVTGTRARAAAPGFSAQQSMWDAMVAREGRLVGGLPSIPPPGRSSVAARPAQGSLQDAAMDVPAQLLGYSRPILIQQLVLRKLASALSQPQPPPQLHAHAHGDVPPPEGSAAGPSAWPAGDAAAALGPPAALAEPVAAASAAPSPSPAAVAQPAASAQ
ncbi:hypothetical protein MNEG_11389, partial [Monoraphidium neglectum]